MILTALLLFAQIISISSPYPKIDPDYKRPYLLIVNESTIVSSSATNAIFCTSSDYCGLSVHREAGYHFFATKEDAVKWLNEHQDATYMRLVVMTDVPVVTETTITTEPQLVKTIINNKYRLAAPQKK